MQCHEFEQRMQTLLDERRLPHGDPSLLAHAQECLDCSQELRAQELLFRNLGRTAEPALGRDFAKRVVFQVESQPARRLSAERIRHWWIAGALATTAAAALLAVTIGLSRNPDVPSPSSLAAPAKSGIPTSPETSLVANHAASKSPLASAHVQSPVVKNVDPLEQYSQAIQSLASQMPQAVERLDEVEQATPGLRPVRNSFSLAFGTIRRTIPPQRKAAAPQRKPSKRDSSWLSLLGGQVV